MWLPALVWAQTGDKAALQRERDRLTQQLATTENLLQQARSNRDNASAQVALLDQQIQLRQKLVNHHEATIRSLERSMNGTDTEIRTLEGHVAALKQEYARMIQQAYRMKLSANPWMFVFAADDFSQAVMRFRLIQSYSESRKHQVAQIEEAQAELAGIRVTLTEEREAVEAALAEAKVARDELRGDRQARAKLVDSLKAEESRLRKAQREQEKERQRLNDEIKRIIEAELAAERASAAGEFALTPAGKIVSEAFEKNQRSLPWPVMRGVVTQGFGRQPHPTLSGITIDNNGVDITTEAGNGVLSIFQGTVSSVFNLPGAGTSVIVTHGAYRTVYSNVAQCALKKGDAVEVGQRLGVVAGAPGSNAILHFEVWKVAGSERTPQDPRTWLKAK
jgi:septal ring factor EnvC (AmiA/AmiB activator)